MNRLMVLMFFYLLASKTTAQVVPINEDIQLIHLQDSVFMHVTWDNDESYGRFSSNGLIIIRSGKALMVDTPSDNDKTERMVLWLKDSLSVVVEEVIVGHFHSDCLGGLGYMQNKGIRSLGNKLTVDKCKELKVAAPSDYFTHSLAFDFYGENVECRFYGPGHSFDNIIVWFPSLKMLFGGCLIKAVDSAGLGNVSDAVLEEWDSTVKKVKNSCGEINIVIPGHGEPGGAELLMHTIHWVENYKNR